MSEFYSFEPIGFIRSCFRQKFCTPRQSLLVSEARAKLEILPQFQPEYSLKGLHEFSHLWVIFSFHLNRTNGLFRAKIHPPRLEGEKRGVFATRSPHRPNPIGLSLVKIEKIDGSGVEVSGADFVDGTPILDIKPYLPLTESVPDARFAAWVAEGPQSISQVDFSPEVEVAISEWQKEINVSGLRSVIEDTLKQDPRPVVYKQSDERGEPYHEAYVFQLYDRDVHFRYHRHNRHIEVFALKPPGRSL